MISEAILYARKLASPIVFKIWTTIAVPVIPDAQEFEGCGIDASSLTDEVLDKLMHEISGREIDVWLPRNLERRLKAHAHRMNAQILSAGYAEAEQFDVNLDISSVLVSAAMAGIKIFEQDDGVTYNETTGLPIGSFPDDLGD